MDIVVTTPYSDATAAVRIDERTGRTTLHGVPDGEGYDLRDAVLYADRGAGGSPPWGMPLSRIVEWSESANTQLAYEEPATTSGPEGAVY